MNYIGNASSPILIIGDPPTTSQLHFGSPFTGADGARLTSTFHKAGIYVSECCYCYIYPQAFRDTKTRNKALFIKKTDKSPWIPTPEFGAAISDLTEFIDRVQPKIIITMGDLALWALMDEKSAAQCRGSMYYYESLGHAPIPLLPTYSAYNLKVMADWNFWAGIDLGRVRDYLAGKLSWEPSPTDFTISPTASDVATFLRDIEQRLVTDDEVKLSIDIETRLGYIDCISIATSPTQAICIPFMTKDAKRNYHYWGEDEEILIVLRLRKIFTNPKTYHIGQNYNFDAQFYAKYWGIATPPQFDTMIAHAVLFTGTPKGLAFLASFYCEHYVYWKDEISGDDPLLGEAQRWNYNCKDTTKTFEVHLNQLPILAHYNQLGPFQRTMRSNTNFFFIMLRGVLINAQMQKEFRLKLQAALLSRELWFESVLPGLKLAKAKTAAPWYRSPKQQAKLFYEEFGLKEIRNRKTKSVTCDDDALKIIMKREPLLIPLCETLLEYRSGGVFLNTFIQTNLDHLNRIHCSYNVVGTETFRLNSSQSVFGEGTNLQNVPVGNVSVFKVTDREREQLRAAGFPT